MVRTPTCENAQSTPPAFFLFLSLFFLLLFSFSYFFKLKDNCFAVLCWPLPSISVDQPQAYICPLPVSPPSHLHTPSHASRLSQSTGLSWLCHTANSHLLSLLYMIMSMCPCCSPNRSHPLLPPGCPQVCFLCPHLHVLYCESRKLCLWRGAAGFLVLSKFTILIPHYSKCGVTFLPRSLILDSEKNCVFLQYCIPSTLQCFPNSRLTELIEWLKSQSYTILFPQTFLFPHHQEKLKNIGLYECTYLRIEDPFFFPLRFGLEDLPVWLSFNLLPIALKYWSG